MLCPMTKHLRSPQENWTGMKNNQREIEKNTLFFGSCDGSSDLRGL